jgi:(p)ppGpp synthase/HD superfamily hydrolase
VIDSGTEQKKLMDALVFAARQHQYQRRSGFSKLPYINHLLKVVKSLMDYTDDSEVLIAGALHDVLEDTDVTTDELTRMFGSRVTAIVGELTDDMSLPYGVRKQMQVDNAHELSKEATLIRVVDKTANIADLRDYPVNWTPGRKRKYIHFSQKVVERLQHVPSQAVDDFIAVVKETLAKLEDNH